MGDYAEVAQPVKMDHSSIQISTLCIKRLHKVSHEYGYNDIKKKFAEKEWEQNGQSSDFLKIQMNNWQMWNPVFKFLAHRSSQRCAAVEGVYELLQRCPKFSRPSKKCLDDV